MGQEIAAGTNSLDARAQIKMAFGFDPAQRRADREAQKAANMAVLMQPNRSLHVGVYSGTTKAAPKEAVKAKPGKRTPTKEEAAWMSALVRYGCIACRIDGYGYVAPQVHHILRGGQRIGHLFTLSLCPGHHQFGQGIPGLIARHPFKARFEQRYGTEMELLEKLRAEIGGKK